MQSDKCNLTRAIMFFCLTLLPGSVLANDDSRSVQLLEYEKVKATVQQYTLAAKSADVDSMKTVFHEKAVAIGSILGRELIDTPESYFQFIRSRPSPHAVGENMITTITELKIDGDIARAQVEFANHWCTSGTNHLGLLKTQNEWKIISMMFWVRPSPPEVDQSMYPVGYCTDSSRTPAQRSDDT